MKRFLGVPQVIREYLDSLTDEERDRVIQATSFKIGGGYKPERTVLRAKQQEINSDWTIGKPITPPEERYVPATGCLIDHATSGTSTEGYSIVGVAFDNFYKRYGNRAIVAIKQYAARRNGIEIPATVEEQQWETIIEEL